MYRIFIFVCPLLLGFKLFAQHKLSVNGSLKDSSGNPIIGAYIQLKTTNNDSLNSISSEAGLFHFSNVEHSNFTLSIRSLGFIEWTGNYSVINIDSVFYLPQIILSKSSNILKEVVIKSNKEPITIKQDTIEFLIKQYNLRENAVVEDLLKRLPGLQVDQDGSISFMGTKINKIRINGKNFPVRDIQDLTKLLPVILLEKIQLIDNYGDFSNLTGRKYGVPEKIINLQTKAAIKETVQLKGSAGIGNSHLYAQDLLGIYMNSKRQFYIRENLNNININASNSISRKGLISYVDQINNSLNINCGVNGEYNDNTISSSSINKIITSEGEIVNTNNNSNNISKNNYYISESADYNPNENFNITSSFIGGIIKQENNVISENTQDGIQRLKQTLTNVDIAQLYDFSGNFFASKRFKNSQSQLVIGINFGSSRNNHQENINNHLQYYISNNIPPIDSTLYQLINKKGSIYFLSPQLSFVKEINTWKSIEIRYSFDKNDNNTKLTTEWLGADEKYIVVDSLSNYFNYTITQHKIGMNIKLNKKKINYILGGDINYYNFVNKNGLFLSPNLNFIYQPNKSTNINFRYILNPRFPSYQQIQSVSDLSNPLFPVVGNPEIKIEFSHLISVEFRHINKSTLFIKINGEPITNKITNDVISKIGNDSIRRQETHYINTSGNYNLDSRYGWSKLINNGKFQLFLDGKLALNESIFFIDNKHNSNKNIIFNQSLKGNYYGSFHETSASIIYSYTRNIYNNFPVNNNIINSWNFSLSNKLIISKSLQVSFEIDKQLNQGFNKGLTSNPTMINTSIEKSIFRNKLTLLVKGYNLLDQTKNIKQTVSSNTITETKTTILGRYLFFLIQWDLKRIK